LACCASEEEVEFQVNLRSGVSGGAAVKRREEMRAEALRNVLAGAAGALLGRVEGLPLRGGLGRGAHGADLQKGLEVALGGVVVDHVRGHGEAAQVAEAPRHLDLRGVSGRGGASVGLVFACTIL
jgi:hypothetical protein